MKPSLFGQYLLNRGRISEEQLNSALRSQRFTNKRLGRTLRDLSVLNQVELNNYLTEFLKPYLSNSDLGRLSSSQSIDLPKELSEWCFSNNLVVLSHDKSTVRFGAKLFDDLLLERCNKKLNQRCFLSVLPVKLFNQLWEAQQLSGTTIHPVSSLVETSTNRERSTPYGEFFRDLLSDAFRLNASDIHIEPYSEGVQVRLRIHGTLHRWREPLSKDHRQAFTLEVKRLCNLDVARSGVPQDSRFSEGQFQSDYRVNLFPVLFGEKIVLRILRKDQKFGLDSLEVDEGTMSAFRRAISLRSGLVIMSGPTGSGKTTTLFRLLNALDRDTTNVSTLEDPVEYNFPGFNQSPIRKGKLSFSDGLRALMRQDPDVILVGEIRDSETAELCLKAASTGHLVFSSIHANSAIETPNRLISMGAPQYLVKSNLRYSFAQRLEQKLCPHCAQDLPKQWLEKVSKSILDLLGTSNGPNLKTVSPNGCSHCDHTGIVGRIPLVERMEPVHIAAYFSGRNDLPIVASSLSELYTSRISDGVIDAKLLRTLV